MEAYQRESISPSFTSYSIWTAVVYSHKKASWNWCMSFLSWWCLWTLESVWVPFCGTQLLHEVHVEGVPWIIWWPTKYTFTLVYMSLDGHGSIAKRIIFSLFYLPQYLNSNCVFSQKNNNLEINAWAFWVGDALGPSGCLFCGTQLLYPKWFDDPLNILLFLFTWV